MSLGGAALILLTAVFRFLFREKVPKGVFLALWELALLRLLIPVSFALPGAALPAVGERVLELAGGVLPAVPGAAGPSAEAGAAAAAEGAPRAAVLTALWLGGAALTAGWFVYTSLRARRGRRRAVPLEDPRALSWLAAQGLRRRVELRALPGLSTPLTYGVLRPVILVPEGLEWDGAAELMLCHELIHIRRFDTLAKLLAAAALCVHWFDPAVWLLWFLLGRDMELACDEAVVRRVGRERRGDYARMLIAMEERRTAPAPLGSRFAGSAMEERIMSIMKMKKATLASVLLAAVLIAVAAGAFAVSALTPEKPAPQGFSSFGAYRVGRVIAGDNIDTSYDADRLYIFRPDFYFLFRTEYGPFGVASESGMIKYVEKEVSPTEFADMGISESMVYTDIKVNSSTVKKYAVTYAGNPQVTLYVLDGSMWIRLIVGHNPALPLIYELDPVPETALEELIGVSWDGLAAKEEELARRSTPDTSSE